MNQPIPVYIKIAINISNIFSGLLVNKFNGQVKNNFYPLSPNLNYEFHFFILFCTTNVYVSSCIQNWNFKTILACERDKC